MTHSVVDEDRLVQLIRSAGASSPPEARALARFSSEVLLHVAESRTVWWVRRHALCGLAGRVDDDTAPRLLARSVDQQEVEEVRCQALELLASAERTEVVPALRRLRIALAAMNRPPYRLDRVVVLTLARLHDLTVALDALNLRYDASTYWSALGETAVRALEESVGNDALQRWFGHDAPSIPTPEVLATQHPEPSVRRWIIDVAGANAPWPVATLDDPDYLVLEGSVAALERSRSDVEPSLLVLAASPSASVESRARAIDALRRRGRLHEASALWRAFPERIELAAVPQEVRRAILHHYLPGERSTDPRWLLEGTLELGVDLNSHREDGPDESAGEILAAARAALEGAGLQVGEAIAIGAIYEQGSGTYFNVAVDGQVLSISTLGRFATWQDCEDDRARIVLGQAGFRFIDAALARQCFQGLSVYFFGKRDPLSVGQLLFYWQD